MEDDERLQQDATRSRRRRLEIDAQWANLGRWPWSRDRWGVVLERTVRELQGTPCIDLEGQPPAKKEIASTRSFGRPVTRLEDLIEAVTEFAQRAA